MNDSDFRLIRVEICEELARRLEALSEPERNLHGMIVRYFAETGAPPAPATLRNWAAELKLSSAEALARLVAVDLIECDPERAVLRGAYPFKAKPVGFTVQISGRVRAEACCAVDSLGIPAMLGKDVTIASRDPHTGEEVSIAVHDALATWSPAEAVVTLLNGVGNEAAGQAGEVACPTVNFHTSTESASAYGQAHGVHLDILTMNQALDLARAAFGPFLGPAGPAP